MIWIPLAAAALAVGAALAALHVPAAWLTGALLVGIAVSVSIAAAPRLDRRVWDAAQIVIGTLAATAFSPAVGAQLGHAWLAVAISLAGTLALSGSVAYVLARFGPLDPATASLGSTAGAAGAMVAIAQDVGADARVVAFMQYTRVTLVVLTASLVAHLLLGDRAHVAASAQPPAISLGHEALLVALTGACAIAFALVARPLRLPSPNVLGPLIGGAIVSGTGLLTLSVPAPLVVAAYVAIGLAIGLAFTRAVILDVVRALPALLTATAALIASCALLGVLLVRVAHVDPLSAYLATTPGGLDSVVAIALSGGANVSFIIALQALRFLVVAATGPAMTRAIALAAARS